MTDLRNPPVATILLTVAAALIPCIPGAAALLEVDWPAVAEGQLWRLWTGHLVHWTAEHLFWDALALVALGAACERESRRTLLFALAAGLPTISLGLAVLCPEVVMYRGLSGIDTGLFVWLMLSQLRLSRAEQRMGGSFLWSALLLGLLGKLWYETVTGGCLFVTTWPEGFRPLVESHWLGAAVGAAAFASTVRWRNGSRRSEGLAAAPCGRPLVARLRGARA